MLYRPSHLCICTGNDTLLKQVMFWRTKESYRIYLLYKERYMPSNLFPENFYQNTYETKFKYKKQWLLGYKCFKNDKLPKILTSTHWTYLGNLSLVLYSGSKLRVSTLYHVLKQTTASRDYLIVKAFCLNTNRAAVPMHLCASHPSSQSQHCLLESVARSTLLHHCSSFSTPLSSLSCLLQLKIHSQQSDDRLQMKVQRDQVRVLTAD